MRARLQVRNHRGTDVPAVLGFVLAAAGALSLAWIVIDAGDPVPAEGYIASGAALLVFCAGLLDDLVGGGPRGLRGHLGALAAGRVTTGTVKLVVIVGAAVVTVASTGDGAPAARIGGVLLLAGAANLWNGLDVRPGRALKFAYPGLGVLGTGPWTSQPFVPGVALAALLVLPWDLGERAMLGDAGANLLGFAVGLHLFHVLGGVGPGWVVLAGALAVALNVLAETITFSRLIEAVPPLRWIDHLGRSPD